LFEDSKQFSQSSIWKVGPHYVIEKVVGKGSYGQVAKAIDLRSNKVVAIKRIQGVFKDATNCLRVLREIKLLHMLDHSNITNLLDVIVGGNDLEYFDEIYLV